MGAPGSANELWARALAARLLPGEPFRWELYEQRLSEVLPGAGLWFDLGAGGTDFIRENAALADGIAVDLTAPAHKSGPFVLADIQALPFRDRSAGTLALRFVVEHLDKPHRAWAECARVLRPGGRLLLITTNRLSPLVALAALVPSSLRRALIARLYRVPREAVLPTHHRWNTPRRVADSPEGFRLERIEYVEALDWSRRWLFRVLLALARLTRKPGLRRFRSNILALYVRQEQPVP
ncbi:class I SAM-dependent methyltransferase [bacterium]|nr:class I SAM-dependent methyltransferase [bacterium]